jgi:RNA polymerase sigma-70 factor (ECF subfamily)
MTRKCNAFYFPEIVENSRAPRRRIGPPSDDRDVSSETAPAGDQGTALLAMYDRALPQVYGYLRVRAGNEAVAEDLTAETFLAAVQAIERDAVAQLTVAWLIGVARHKLVDHWRREARESRGLRALPEEQDVPDGVDEMFERARTHEVLAELGPHHRAALTLRYIDGLPVHDVAQHLDRTVHATEALLVRARNAFRVAYARGELDAD